MKLTTEQITLVKNSKTAEELIENAATAGIALDLEQAQKYIDEFEYKELPEDELDIAAGGCFSDVYRSYVCPGCNQYIGDADYEVVTQPYNGTKVWHKACLNS